MGRLSGKLLQEADSQGGRELLYWCPGCEGLHQVALDNPNACGARWVWNGNAEQPTLTPSVNVNPTGPERCHHFISDGRIQFCTDSQHHLAGKTVDLPDFEE